ncbi:MAG TPA: SUF system NifU family Fe-S cluster assembly protein [Longimicrobiales bacterium]|nr:SUF system NifU family Fe-S cluster assembly protein [Longimicrobiales bacterium]
MTIDRSTPALDSLYQELILDHFKRPHNKGELEAATHQAHLHNPVCGDEVHVHARVEDGRVAELTFTGQGCSISQASVSMMTDLVKGKSVAEAEAITGRFSAMMHGDADAAQAKELGNARALAGVAKFPVRIKCALLGWEALGEALGTGTIGRKP